MDPGNNNAGENQAIIVENPSFAVTKGLKDCPEVRSLYYFKIPETTMFLDIKDGSVVADDWTSSKADETKKICKIVRFEVNTDQRVNFKAALRSETTSKYIVFGSDRQVQLDDSPMWFEVESAVPKVMFKNKDLYLAYNTQTHHIVAADTEFQFEEFPVEQDVSQTDN